MRGRENPSPPQHSPEGGQGIEERGGALRAIPGKARPGCRGALRDDVPEPDGGVDPEGETGGPLGPLAPPALGVLTPQELLGVAEGVFDRPAAGVRLGNPRWRRREVGRASCRERVFGYV